MFTLLTRAKGNEDIEAWIVCLWLGAGVVVPLMTVVWGLSTGYAWLWESMCIAIWAGLFWWTGRSAQAGETGRLPTDEEANAEEEAGGHKKPNTVFGNFSFWLKDVREKIASINKRSNQN